MSRLAIIVEGYTEFFFVKRVLSQHLESLQVTPINLRGGRISIQRLVKEVQPLIHQFTYVTTLVDYYGFSNPKRRSVDDLEEDLHKLCCSHSTGRLFIPYIQKYEFEALVLADTDLVIEVLGGEKEKRIDNTKPEDINHNRPPSKRIKEIHPRYIKTTHGITVLEKMNWEGLREKCPRFNQWITKLERLS